MSSATSSLMPGIIASKANQEAAALLSQWKAKYPKQAEEFQKQDAAAGKERP